MPHLKERRKKAFTLLELAIVLVIIGLIAVLIFPAITDFVKFGKKTEAKDFVGQIKDKVIGQAMMGGKCLPKRDDFEDELGVSVDPYGQKLIYYVGSELVCGSGGIESATSTDLTVRKVEYGGSVSTYEDIAFVIASTGRNVHQEFDVVGGSTIVTIYDPREWHNAPGHTGEYDEYDDIVEYVSLAYLKNKVVTNTAMESFEPQGSDVSFNKNLADFNDQDVSNPYGLDAGTVKINLEEGTVELGGGDGHENDRGCLWYQGDNPAGNCSDGMCAINYGIRAFFTFKYATVDDSADSGDVRSGFTFALIDGVVNDSDVCGNAGLYMGYAGTYSGDSVRPRKMAVEVDSYPNPASPFFDPANNHVAFVYYDGNGGSGDGNRNNDVGHQDFGDTVSSGCFDGNRNPPSSSPDPEDADAIHNGGTKTWLEDGVEHTLRIEIYRNAAGGGCAEVFNSTVWIDCTNCTDLTLPWNTTYGTYDAIIQHNCTVGGNATFPRMRFGWTEGTGGGESQNLVISDFGIKFLNNVLLVNHPY